MILLRRSLPETFARRAQHCYRKSLTTTTTTTTASTLTSSDTSSSSNASTSSCRKGTKSVGAANAALVDNHPDEELLLVAQIPMQPFPQSPRRTVPPHIIRPPYAETGYMPAQYDFIVDVDSIFYHRNENSVHRMRQAARLARRVLDMACAAAEPGVTTDEIDKLVHDAIIQNGAYPSPLNYAGFPKSVCSSINEVICHGIPDTRPLQVGDVVSFDVSCYLEGVHGDNCATVIVGDRQDKDEGGGVDWRGVPYKMDWSSQEEASRIAACRRLVKATREGLYAGIHACHPGGCISHIGNAIHAIADDYGYDTVRKYRGHGISSVFHTAPFVKHFRNRDKIPLREGMIFTIEPMFTAGGQDCREWADDWTVVTLDGSFAAQFEHTVLITSDGVEILTLPESEWS